MTPKQWKIIANVWEHAWPRLGCFWCDREEFDQILALVKLETNEARKLGLAYYELYPKEDPAIHLANNPNMTPVQLWESLDCTYSNWLERLRENPTKALSVSNWCGKVTKAYFKMKGLPLPKYKSQMVEIVTELLKQEGIF